eukprot:TRINITY_DN87866_c0_g1_i1.p1 TRINITY_DN87866_c0_g1~~TRINITY_DN87866_c0_g1_i1.p1  ORF type:complete len:489 (+),score=79.88 TRINITY_DN87866_c0_g1_i1:31-1497(+)
MLAIRQPCTKTRAEMPLVAGGSYQSSYQQCHSPAPDNTKKGGYRAEDVGSNQYVGRQPPWASPLATPAFLLDSPARTPEAEALRTPRNSNRRKQHEKEQDVPSPDVMSTPPGLEDISFLFPEERSPRGETASCEQREALLLSTPPSKQAKEQPVYSEPPSPLCQTPDRTGWRTVASRVSSITLEKSFAWSHRSDTCVSSKICDSRDDHTAQYHSDNSLAEPLPLLPEAMCRMPRPCSVQELAAARSLNTWAQKVKTGKPTRGPRPLPVGLQSDPKKEVLPVQGNQRWSQRPWLSEVVPPPNKYDAALVAAQVAQEMSAAAAAAWAAAAQAAEAASKKSLNVEAAAFAPGVWNQARCPVEARVQSEASQPKEEAHVFKLTLRKADGIEMGLSVSHANGQPPVVINAVRPGGAMESWNKLCVGDRANRLVMKGDHLLSVNGISEVPGILAELWSKQLLQLEIWRPAGDLPVCSDESNSWVGMWNSREQVH